jgi:hypothetical protein
VHGCGHLVRSVHVVVSEGCVGVWVKIR